ncbi:MAG: glutathione S-transferase N-terminal domain-containing protein [Parvibaculales bacterium]
MKLDVYGCNISYYTGKLEAYLRYRSIPYQSLPTVGNEKKLLAGAGVVQMPVVQIDDGRWMTDTTPMLAWLDGHYEDGHYENGTIYPADPMLRFVALLIEDYADEWLWRPAMHYRWSYRLGRVSAAEAIYTDIVEGNRAIPRWLAIRLIKARQLGGFVKGDGVTRQTLAHTEQTYFTALDRLQNIFERRPFVLGATPSIADYGLMGPMLRHFSQDPVPAEIMRARAPAVFEWVARMWNAKATNAAPQFIDKADDALAALLGEACDTNLVQHAYNAQAFTAGAGRYDMRVQETDYKRIPTSRYRVWCLENLRRAWAALDAESQNALKAVLPPSAAILWQATDVAPSDYDSANDAPFNRGINVYGKGVPGIFSLLYRRNTA